MSLLSRLVLLLLLKPLSQEAAGRIMPFSLHNAYGVAARRGTTISVRSRRSSRSEVAPMFEPETLVVRCRQCIHDRNQDQGWGLSNEQIDIYVEQIVGQVPAHSLERQMAQIVGYFHNDHRRVADLHDPSSANHAASWKWVTTEIARAAQIKGLSWSRDPMVDLDDLVQTVQTEVVRSLPGYHFESLLSTWLHGLTVRRLRRFHRDNSAAKRAVRPESLEAAIEQGVDVTQNDQMLLASVLWAEIKRVLAPFGDERYANIFLMRVVGDFSSEEIGARLQLHPSRVRALLRIGRDLLRSSPSLRSWEEDQQPKDDDIL